MTFSDSDFSLLVDEIATLYQRIAELQAQLSIALSRCSDHEPRILSLEFGNVLIGPFIGQQVHLRDVNGKCIPAIIIRQSSTETISVIHLEFDRETRQAKWVAVFDIQKDHGANSPMTSWHIPENNLP